MKTGERKKTLHHGKQREGFPLGGFGLKFDQRKIAVRIVTFGDVFGRLANIIGAAVFLNQNENVCFAFVFAKRG